MKISISLPDHMAKEIKTVSQKTEKSVSYLIQVAWNLARTNLFQKEQEDLVKKKKKAIDGLWALRGTLKDDFPDMDSVTLAKKAFRLKGKDVSN